MAGKLWVGTFQDKLIVYDLDSQNNAGKVVVLFIVDEKRTVKVNKEMAHLSTKPVKNSEIREGAIEIYKSWIGSSDETPKGDKGTSPRKRKRKTNYEGVAMTSFDYDHLPD